MLDNLLPFFLRTNTLFSFFLLIFLLLLHIPSFSPSFLISILQ
nr:MAG TPA: hypothetical protein [Caudoviricetes sp.]